MPPAKHRAVFQAPEQIAKRVIAKRGKPSAVPGYVKLTMTFDLKRELAARLSAQAIRDGMRMEAMILELVKSAMIADERCSARG